VTEPLSSEWFEQLKPRLAGRLEPLDVDVGLQCLIGGGPDGDVKCYGVITEGEVVEAGLGSLDAADLTVTIDYDDVVRIDRGELDPNVAYMQGRLKVAGDLAKLMALLPLTRPSR